MTITELDTADSKSIDSSAESENFRKWELSRRNLLKLMGAAGAAAIAAPVLPGLFGNGAIAEAAGDDEPQRLRRWVMVIDLSRCDGCISLGVPPQCTQYCNWARVVPEGMQWFEVYDESTETIPGTAGERPFLPAPCMHCQSAPCVNVCPVGATFHTPEGVVLIDQQRCIGCRLCMVACPYDRRFFNWGEPIQLPEAKTAPYDVRTQMPAIKGTVMKCDFCTERLAVGGLPFCVEGCPHSGIYIGDLEEDIASNGEEVVQLSRLLEDGNAFRYKEELGTQPRVYYLSGHGENTTRTHHEPFLKKEVEWPWKQIAKQRKQWKALASAQSNASGEEA